MTLLDLVLLVVVALAALGGWRRGLTGFGPGLVGLLLGLAVGGWLAGVLVTPAASAGVHLLLVAAFLVGGAVVGSALGNTVGGALGRGLSLVRLRPLDRAAGAVVRAGLAVVVVWVLAGIVGGLVPGAAGLASRSAVLGQVADVLPERDGLLADTAGALGVPADVLALVPSSATRSLDPAEVGEVAAAAGRSVVKIEGTGCGTGVEGSGFVVDGGLVVTNAHVVTGTSRLTVADTGGTHRATAVLVDDDADLAVLRVDGLDAPALTLADGAAGNGTTGVVLGYPGDGRLTAVPATVVQRLPVVQPGVDGGYTSREVYRLRAVVREGNSGGPLVDGAGDVVGVVNARSATDDDTGFALTLTTLRTDLARAAGLTAAASTGGCRTAA
ncbi:MarP family serine protease [Rhodococcus aerolatus]